MHWNAPFTMLFPALGLLIWLAVVLYLLTLAKRLVRAVEQIAQRLG